MSARRVTIAGVLSLTNLLTLSAQQLHLSGKVVDEDGKGRGGITVRVVGQGEATTKPQSGEFSVPLKSDVRAGAVVAVTVIPDAWMLMDYPDSLVTVRLDDAPPLVLRVAKKGLPLLTDDRIRKILESLAQAREGLSAISDPNLRL
jgi:hypothetical protein